MHDEVMISEFEKKKKNFQIAFISLFSFLEYVFTEEWDYNKIAKEKI